MPRFVYAARDAQGRAVNGDLEADSSTALADALAERGLLLVRAAPKGETGGTSLREKLLGHGIGDVELMLFFRQLATMLKAGVPLLRALQSLEESATKPAFAQVLVAVQRELEGGKPLSAALAQHERVFSRQVLAVVKVGEVTGRLPEVFAALARQVAFERDNREQVRAALRYPMFVIATALAALVAVNVFVIPAFARIYRGFNAELPLLTQGLILVSNFVTTFWPLLVAGSVGATLLAVNAVRQPAGRLAWHRFLLQLPVIGALVHRAALARFSKSFALALSSGVPAVDALKVAVDTSDNAWMAQRISTIGAAAERGESLARAARTTGAFTPAVLQMIAVGEETGALPEMMEEIAQMYQREVDYEVKGLAQKIEPVMVVVLGLLILVFALGVFLPLWDLSRAAIR